MKVTIVKVHVKPEFIEEFIQATKINHKNSVQESGNLRFDVLQSPQDTSQFILYEAYDSEESAKAHKATPHYITWRDTVADWMASAREGMPYEGLLPEISSE